MKGRGIAFWIVVAIAVWTFLGLIGGLARGDWGLVAVCGVILFVQGCFIAGHLITDAKE
jgi:hypothetical protein